MLGHHVVDGRGAGARVGQVERPRLGPSAGQDDLLDDPGHRVMITVGDLHDGTLGGEPGGDGRTDPAGRAGDEADLVDEAPRGGRLRVLHRCCPSAPPLNTVRCHGLAATPVMSNMTCLTTV